jgi:molecular chaperone DnaJ
MNLWETLGVSKVASLEEIKRAWRKKAFQFHPDRGGDAELFKRALFAYEVLSGRWQTSSASTGWQSGQGEQRPAGATFEQNEEFRQYAQAYYDAWYSVPDTGPTH